MLVTSTIKIQSIFFASDIENIIHFSIFCIKKIIIFSYNSNARSFFTRHVSRSCACRSHIIRNYCQILNITFNFLDLYYITCF